jgi:hypothetical protein
MEANLTLAARRIYTGYVNTDATGSVQWKSGQSTVNLSGGTGRNRQVEEGFDYVDELPSNDRLETRRKINSYFNRDPYISASWALEQAQDKAIRANVRWQPSRFDLEQRNRVTPAGGACAEAGRPCHPPQAQQFRSLCRTRRTAHQQSVGGWRVRAAAEGEA